MSIGCKGIQYVYGGVDLADFHGAVNGRRCKSPSGGTIYLRGLLDRTLANSFVVSKKLTHENMTMLTYWRHVMQSLITLAKPPKVGRPIGNTTSSDSQSVRKRCKSNYSVNGSICLEHLGCHWVIYVSGRERCEVCS